MKLDVKAIAITLFITVPLVTQFNSMAFARAFKSPNLGGATGLIATPTGHIGWGDANMAIDMGYHLVNDDNRDTTHIPKVLFNFRNKFEAGFAYDTQEDDNEDILINAKFKFFDDKNKSAVAVGGNAQMLNMAGESYNAFQIYLAATFVSDFLNMPAETTVVLGKHFGDDPPVNNDDIDFSTGFDMNFFPQYLQNYVHWITEFANYSYSMNAYGANARIRGTVNTGFRIAALKQHRRYKLNLDAFLTDAFDENRGFTLGLCFGTAF